MILFVGLAGSGKTIQGRLLAQKLGLNYFSIGELLRASSDPELNQKLLDGDLIGDDEVITLIDKILPNESLGQNQCVLDGFPRSLAQADWLIIQLNLKRFKSYVVIHLVASEEVTSARLIDRGRPDDIPNAISKRVEEYKGTIIPIVDKLKSVGVEVYDVNAEQTIEEVQKEILVKLNIKEQA